MATRAERERQHQANLQRIGEVQLVVGRGDRTRIDHEGSLLEQARMWAEEIGSHEATERGLAALERLLRLAAERQSTQARNCFEFLRALREQRAFPLPLLRGVEREVGDDMLAVLDAYRYARVSLIEQVEGGARRVGKVIDRWLQADRALENR